MIEWFLVAESVLSMHSHNLTFTIYKQSLIIPTLPTIDFWHCYLPFFGIVELLNRSLLRFSQTIEKKTHLFAIFSIF